RRVTPAGIERIAHHAAPAGIGHVDPQLGAFFLQVPVHVEVRDPRFDQARGVALVYVDDPIHPLQIQHDAARIDRSRTAITEVAPGRDRIDRYPPLVRGADYGLNFLDIRRSHCRGSDTLLRLVPQHRVEVAIGVKV